MNRERENRGGEPENPYADFVVGLRPGDLVTVKVHIRERESRKMATSRTKSDFRNALRERQLDCEWRSQSRAGDLQTLIIYKQIYIRVHQGGSPGSN